MGQVQHALLKNLYPAFLGVLAVPPWGLLRFFDHAFLAVASSAAYLRYQFMTADVPA
ncbi:hypothetical protein J2Y63_002886 [Shinella sp. BE166]|uniref:hypothetical protein n=1 Tax=Shinella sp. BE166 TaxID=3373918 RepID=UPI003EB82509